MNTIVMYIGPSGPIFVGKEVNKIRKAIIGILSFALVVAGLLGGLPTLAISNSTIIVTPAHTNGWSTADTRTGGAVNYIADTTAPGNPHTGALQLTTDVTTTAKAQYLHSANTNLANVTELSYYTKQVSALFAGGDPSYQLPVYLNGTTGFTTMVFEPYENGVVTPNVWQNWNVASGQFWSTRSVICSNGAVVAGHGGAPFYTLAQLKTMCPQALVIGYGVNIGTNNPGYNVETDLFNFNGTTYNFEVTNIPTEKDQCKKGGYLNLTNASGMPFTNQGQCVSFVETNKNHNEGQDTNNQDNNSDEGNTNSDNQVDN